MSKAESPRQAFGPPTIRFSADKNGRPLAYRWSVRAMRWIKIGYDEAKLLVSTGRAKGWTPSEESLVP